MALHTINPLASFSEDEVVNAAAANFAFKAVCMIGVITSHDSLV
jgi:hypothetical protein